MTASKAWQKRIWRGAPELLESINPCTHTLSTGDHEGGGGDLHVRETTGFYTIKRTTYNFPLAETLKNQCKI